MYRKLVMTERHQLRKQNLACVLFFVYRAEEEWLYAESSSFLTSSSDIGFRMATTRLIIPGIQKTSIDLMDAYWHISIR